MKTRIVSLLSLLMIVALLAPVGAPSIAAEAVSAPPQPLVDGAVPAPSAVDEAETRVQVERAFGQMSLIFVENQGQMDKQVVYYVQGGDKTIYFTPEGVTFALTKRMENEEWRMENEEWPSSLHSSSLYSSLLHSSSRWAVKLDFVGANPDARPVGEDQTATIISYFKGPQEEWHTGLPTYSRIVYRDLWPGIDLVYYGTVNQLKYEFVVHPGADPAQIRLAYRGATDVALNAAGQMEVTTPLGGFTDDTPVAYQEVDGQRVPVEMDYHLLPDAAIASERVVFEGATLDLQPATFNFSIGAYDPTRPLILDPAVLVYCGYIGGAMVDRGEGIAVDGTGNAYVTGYTYSDESTFPVVGGPDLTYNGNGDAFVVKVRADGGGLVYAGYIGGTGGDNGQGIAVDETGHAYVTGHTDSDESTFPVVGGPDLIYNGGSDTFVIKVQADGAGLIYAGYVGGAGEDWGLDIAVDGTGHAYVTGETRSDESTFPVVGGPDLTYNGGYFDAFVVKVQVDGAGLIYAGYIGGEGQEVSWGIAVDTADHAYVTGCTESDETTFPVVGGPDLTFNGGYDVFVAKVRADGSGLVYAGYIGGAGSDWGYDIAVDGTGHAYVTGYTDSYGSTFPVVGGPDLGYNGYGDAFVVKVQADGGGLIYAGYIGGTGGDSGQGIAVDETGHAYVTGDTQSNESTFPVVGGPDLIYNGGYQDAFVVKVQVDGARLVYCGYIGGATYYYETGRDIAVDGAGAAYVTGYTYSDEATFPVVGGPDLTYNGGYDAFVAKVSGEGGPTYSISGHVRDGSGDPISDVAVSAGLGSSATTDASGVYTITNLAVGTYLLIPSKSGYTFFPSVRVVRVASHTINQDFATFAAYGSLIGQITDQTSGSAIANARVSAGGKASHTDTNGHYTLTGLLPGLHNLYVTADGYEDFKSEVVIEVDTSTIRDVALSAIATDGYYLPYPGGTTYQCTQGNGGPDSHQGTWYYAFDFGMPKGRDVVAAQSGWVVAVKEDSNTFCGSKACINDANYVRIRHQDGTDTLYYHLNYQSVLVNVGDAVNKGQMIAQSDTTGWCTGPHLDFTRHKWGEWNSISISFVDVSGNGIPQAGHDYTSGNYPAALSLYTSNITTDSEPPQGSVNFRFTGQPTHTLELRAFDYFTDVTEMRLATIEFDLQAATWLSFTTRTMWIDPVVFAQFKDANGNVSEVVSDTVDAIGYEPLQANFAVQPTVCVGQGLSLTNQTVPFCEQCGWWWDFGDGTTSERAEPEFDYVARSSFAGYASPGAYTVTLTATNAISVSTDSHQVEALAAPSDGFTIIQSGTTITVEAESATAASWNWDFGDGIKATGRVASHTYTDTVALDTYPVQLTVESHQGCISFLHKFVSIPLTTLDVDGPTTGLIEAPYTFVATVNATATTPVTYTWAPQGGSVVTHTGGISDTAVFSWTTPGLRTIVVNATNTGGMIAATHEITLYTPTHAAFTATPTLGSVPLTVNFLVLTDSGVNTAPPCRQRFSAFMW